MILLRVAWWLHSLAFNSEQSAAMTCCPARRFARLRSWKRFVIGCMKRLKASALRQGLQAECSLCGTSKFRYRSIAAGAQYKHVCHIRPLQGQGDSSKPIRESNQPSLQQLRDAVMAKIADAFTDAEHEGAEGAPGTMGGSRRNNACHFRYRRPRPGSDGNYLKGCSNDTA